MQLPITERRLLAQPGRSEQLKHERATDFNEIRKLVADDFERVDVLIQDHLLSEVQTVVEIARHLVGGGGKRLRPLVVLLSARACSYQGEQHTKLAALVEFLHTATLLHDDVIDESSRRRGAPTANALWGNSASVLVGDFLYSKAFELMVELGRLDVIEILSDATHVIAEGEVMQLENVSNVDLSESSYMEIIYRKSARLFEAAAHTAAVLARSSTEVADQLRSFGKHFGLAFQIVDDVLDYAGDSSLLGKNVGDDLADGKPTLPLLQAIKASNSEDAEVLRTAITTRSRDMLNRVINVVIKSGALEYAHLQAELHTKLALESLRGLERSVYRNALEALAEFALSRIK